MRFFLLSATPSEAFEAATPGRGHAGAKLLLRGQLLSWTGLPTHADFVVPLLDDIGDARGAVLHRVATRADR